MSGRAGRPQYDPYGEAILIASTSDEQDYLMENYVLASPERLYSRLAQESALRGHTLAAVASDFAHTEQGLLDFFGGTFYGYHYPAASIKLILTGILRYLDKEGMLEEKGDYLYATDFGRRTSELYIDPLSATIIRDGLRRGAMDVSDFTWLHLICHTPDMNPILRPRRGEMDEVEGYAEERKEEFACPVTSEGDYIEFEQFLGEVKTAMVLDAWINEKTENEILERYGVQPGDRYAAVHNAEWLLYATRELADIVGAPDHKRHLGELEDRIKHGVTKKLLPLVRLKGVGRVRARVLYNSGFTNVSALTKAPLQRLVEIPLIGPRLAKSIKEQVGGLVEEEEWERLKRPETEQRALTEFVEEKHEDERSD
jgi:helicase